MSTRTKKAKRPDPNVYPSGLNYRRAQAIAKYYDERKGEDFIGDVELPTPESMSVWVEVPQGLLPEVRRLIARYKKSA